MKKPLIKIFFVLIIIITALSLMTAVYAENDDVTLSEAVNGTDIATGKCGDNATWIFNSATGELTITGTGDMYDYGNDIYGIYDIPWYSFKENIKKTVICEGVTSIGDSAFIWCENMTDIEISHTVKRIETGVFYGCDSLTELIIPSGTEHISQQAIFMLDNLKKIYISDTVSEIGYYFADACDNLEEIIVSEKNPYFYSTGYSLYTKDGKELIRYAPAIGTTHIYYFWGVEIIHPYAFDGCDKLREVKINEGVKNIGMAFSGCSSLSKANIPSTVTWSAGAFSGTNIRTAGPVGGNYDLEYAWTEKIPSGAFDGNELESITIPVSMKKIEYAFDGCPLTDVYYEGDEEQWADIEISPYAEELLNATIHYNCFDTVAQGKIGEDIEWILNNSGNLRITGSGKMPNFTYDSVPWKDYSSQIRYVYISSQITNIGDYAFYNHTKLSHIDFGKNCTEIGDYAFSGCTNLKEVKLPTLLVSVGEGAFYSTALKKVNIPGRVDFVGDKAFDGCDNLTVIKFDGNPPSVFSPICADNTKIVIYYDRNYYLWERNTEDGKWNGFVVLPVNKVASLSGSQSSEYKNYYMIKVSNSDGEPVAEASVTLDNVTKTTNSHGEVYFEKPTDGVTLKIESADYNTYCRSEYIPSNGHTDYVTLSFVPSTVEGISVNGKSISSSVYILNCNKSEYVNINIQGYSPQKIKKYELYQGTRLIRTISTSEENCTFSVSAKSFEEGETVFAKMYVKDGSSVISPLNIDVINLANISEAQILDELSNMELIINPANIGEIRIPLQFKTDTKNAFYTVVEGKTIKVGINLNLNNFTSNFEGLSPAHIRNKIQKAVDNSLKNYKKTSPGIGYKLSGYIEIEYLGNGKYYVKTNYVKLAVSANLSFNAQASFFQIVGIYFKASLSGDGSLALTISRYSPETDFTVKDATVSIKNELTIEGGGYIIAGLGSAALYGTADMGFDLGLVPNTEFKKVYINGNVGVKWSVFWGLWGKSHPFWKGKIFEWTKEGTVNLHDIDDFGYSSVSDIAKGGINPRLYLKRRSGWMPDTVELMDVGESSDTLLQSDAYNDIQPKIVKTSNDTVMVWLDDDEGQNADNFKALYYSLYTDGNWSAPQKVNDNSRMDCEFDVINYKDKVYIIYTQQDYTLGDVDTLFTQGEDGNLVVNEDVLRMITEYVEVHIAVLNNGNFISDTTITNNYLCETLPSLSVQNGDLIAMWNVSDGFGFKEGYDILYKSILLDDGNWSKAEVVTDKQRNIVSITAGMLNGKYMYAYVADADSDVSTTDEYILVIKSENGEAYVADSGMISSPEFSVINGQEVLLWLKDMKLMCITEEDSLPYTYDFIIDGEYEITDDGENTLIIYDGAKKDGKGGISAVYINNDGTAGTPFVIVDNGRYTDSFAVLNDDNEIGIAYMETYTDTEDDELIFRSDFRYAHMNIGCMLTLDNADVTFDDDKIFVDISYSNNGFEQINGAVISVYDSENNVIYTDTYSDTLKSGESKEREISFDIPETLNGKDYIVCVLPLGTDELSPDDNIRTISPGFRDVGIYGEQKVIAQRNYAEITLKNLGNIPSSGRVNVYSGDIGDTPSESFEYEELLPGESRVYLIDVSSSSSESAIRSFEAVTEGDMSVLNNSLTMELFDINTSSVPSIDEEIVPDPVITSNNFDYDLPFGAGVEIGVTSGMEMFSGIDGLILDEDYFVSDDSIIISDEYIRNLEYGTHSFRLVFIYNQEEIYKNISVYVYNSIPVGIGGSVAIVGDTVAFGVLKADVSELTPFGAEVAYYWYIDGECVQTGDTYTVSPDDVGKTVYLEVWGADEHPGIIGTEVVISKSNQTAPHSPVIKSLTCTSVTFVGEDNTEYSMDMIDWQDDASFTGLTFNEEYTFYSRKKSSDYAYESEASKGVAIVIDGVHNYQTETLSPTCTKIGYTKYTCTDCGNVEKKNSKPPLGHNWGEWEVETAATCCDGGTNKRYCPQCESFEYEYTNSLGHTDENSEWEILLEPSCVVGMKILICKNTGWELEMEEIPPNGQHIYEAHISEPTCQGNGYTEYVCIMCEASYISDITPALEHRSDGGHIEGDYLVTRCMLCNEIISQEEYNPPSSGGGSGGSTGSTKIKTVRVEIFSDLARLRAEEYEYDDYTGMIIVALYDDNDILKTILRYDAQSRIETEITEESEYSYAKLMWIYDMVSMKPMCESELVYKE